MTDTFRLRFMFWLDLNKPDENNLAETIEQLKQERSFSRAIRQGLRLWMSLRRRDVSVLLELFPDIREMIGDQPERQQTPEPDRLQLTIESTVKAALEAHMPTYLTDGLQRRLAVQLPAPTQQNDVPALEIRQAQTDTGNRSDWNFMISSAALQSNLDSLPPDVIQYGLETGRFPEAIRQQARVKLEVRKRDIQPVTVEMPVKKSNPHKMDVPQFDAPEFDDLDAISV